MPKPLPLAHIKVLDLTRVQCRTDVRPATRGLGRGCHQDRSSPGSGDGQMGDARHGPDFQNLHRNKRSITLNLKAEAGRAAFLKLAESADVIVENYRPDVKHRLGVDYDTVRAINPGVVYASISGFGQDGPYGNLPGFDQVAQGMGGLMSITGLPGQGPVRAGIPVADLSAGLFAALGVMTALLGRTQTGEGQWIRTSLLEAQVTMLDFQAERWLLGHEVPPQAGNNHPTGIPDRGVRDRGRTHQHRGDGRRHLQALLRRHGARGLAHRRTRYATPSKPVYQSRCDERGDRGHHADSHQPGMDRAVQRRRRAGRLHLRHQRGLRRSASQASRDGGTRPSTRYWATSNWSPSRSRCRLRSLPSARPPRNSASTPRRCWPSTATRARTSKPCAPPARSRRADVQRRSVNSICVMCGSNDGRNPAYIQGRHAPRRMPGATADQGRLRRCPGRPHGRLGQRRTGRWKARSPGSSRPTSPDAWAIADCAWSG